MRDHLMQEIEADENIEMRIYKIRSVSPGNIPNHPNTTAYDKTRKEIILIEIGISVQLYCIL